MKRKLPALLLLAELLLITIMHIVKYNQQSSTSNKEHIVVSEQTDTPTLQINQNVVYKITR